MNAVLRSRWGLDQNFDAIVDKLDTIRDESADRWVIIDMSVSFNSKKLLRGLSFSSCPSNEPLGTE